MAEPTEPWGELPESSGPPEGTSPLPRSQEQIAERWKATQAEDFFGFAADIFIACLNSPAADDFLKEEFRGKHEADVKTLPHAVQNMRAYYVFAWGKALDHRGISASRSVVKLTQWAWMIGRDDLVAALEKAPHAMYGAPALREVARHMGWPWPEDNEAAQRMSVGEPCVPGCGEGCD